MTDELQQKNSTRECRSTPEELGAIRQNIPCCYDDKPVFLDDEGPSEVVPQGIYVTIRDE